MGFVNKQQDALLCEKLTVSVNQEDELYFLDMYDVIQLIKDRGDSIVGQPKATINVSEIEKGKPKYVISSNAQASFAPLRLAIIANSFDVVSVKSNLLRTCAVSRICGMAFGETKLPKSTVSNPHLRMEFI